jgi:branched-chain amino acid transport system permease protein
VVTRSGSYWIGLICAVISGALLGAGIDRFFMRPIFKRVNSGPIVMIAPVVATLALLGIIQAVIGFIWGLSYQTIEAPISTGGLNIFGSIIAFSPFNLMLTILFQKTNIGLALRASAYAPEIAKLSGIRVDAVRTLGWALAGAAGGLAGMLYIPGANLYPNAMDVLLVFGFIAAVIGGLDSLFGAVAGAMILGFAVNFSASYISYKLVFPTAFVILILVLLIRPKGVFSSGKGRKD